MFKVNSLTYDEKLRVLLTHVLNSIGGQRLSLNYVARQISTLQFAPDH